MRIKITLVIFCGKNFILQAPKDGVSRIYTISGVHQTHKSGFTGLGPTPALKLNKSKKTQKDTKVILTVRDNDEQWWKSWCGFMTQEYTRFTIGDFCVGGLLNIFAKKGYFGPKMMTIMEVG